MDQMRMDPKHQFAAQYVLSRAANERREREALLTAAAMNMSHLVTNALHFNITCLGCKTVKSVISLFLEHLIKF